MSDDKILRDKWWKNKYVQYRNSQAMVIEADVEQIVAEVRLRTLKEVEEMVKKEDDRCMDFKVFTMPDANVDGSSMCQIILDRLSSMKEPNSP